MPPTSVSVKAARKRLRELVDEVDDGALAVEIVGKNSSAVLLSKKRYEVLQEATFLLRSPELMDSLRREMERTQFEATAPATAPASTSGHGRSKNKKKKKRRKRQRSR